LDDSCGGSAACRCIFWGACWLGWGLASETYLLRPLCFVLLRAGALPPYPFVRAPAVLLSLSFLFSCFPGLPGSPGCRLSHLPQLQPAGVLGPGCSYACSERGGPRRLLVSQGTASFGFITDLISARRFASWLARTPPVVGHTVVLTSAAHARVLLEHMDGWTPGRLSSC
jgi:hypothetical protein